MTPYYGFTLRSTFGYVKYNNAKSMEQAQAECRRLRREVGTAEALAEARAIESEWRSHPDYESDYAWLMRMQSGRQIRPRAIAKGMDDAA